MILGKLKEVNVRDLWKHDNMIFRRGLQKKKI